MPDPIFAHPRLAAIYDTFDGPRDDLDAYLAIADEFGARRVLDLGCGTGCLAVLLVATGRQVIAVDPAGASLDVATSKWAAATVTWIEGDASVIPPDSAVDLAVMTGNAAQAVLGDDEWATLLGHVRAALVPGGFFVFESRRPERRAWEEWAQHLDPVRRDVPGVGIVEQRGEVTAVDLPLVSFRQTYRFLADGPGTLDTELRSESTLRFRGRDELTASLEAAGFRVHDVREAPDRPGREFVFLARRS